MTTSDSERQRQLRAAARRIAKDSQVIARARESIKEYARGETFSTDEVIEIWRLRRSGKTFEEACEAVRVAR